jgi:hypothetical protein
MADVALIIAAVVIGMAAIPALAFMLWFFAPFVLIGVGVGSVVFAYSNQSVPPFFAVAGLVLASAGGMWMLQRYDDGP